MLRWINTTRGLDHIGLEWNDLKELSAGLIDWRYLIVGNPEKVLLKL